MTDLILTLGTNTYSGTNWSVPNLQFCKMKRIILALNVMVRDTAQLSLLTSVKPFPTSLTLANQLSSLLYMVIVILLYYFFKRFYLLFVGGREREREIMHQQGKQQAEGKAGSLLSKEPDVGLDHWTLES